MPGLGEVTREGDWGRWLKLAGAMGLLLAGLAALTAGSARVATDFLVGLGVPLQAAQRIAIVTAATLPPIVLAGTLAYITHSSAVRLFGLGGVALALGAVAVGLPLGLDRVGTLVALLYGVGLFVVVAALVQGTIEDASPAGTGRTGTVSSSDLDMGSFGSPGPGTMPADGGAEDDDLTFLLDDDEDGEE
ncbi:MAG: hypothetical protein ABEI31_09035 [Halodesulfurarchaeum sp.]